MKRRYEAQSVSRRAVDLGMAVCRTVQNFAQKLYALRFYFFVFFFTRLPIPKNCS